MTQSEEMIKIVEQRIDSIITEFNSKQRYLDEKNKYGQYGYSATHHKQIITGGKMWLIHYDMGVICTIFSDGPHMDIQYRFINTLAQTMQYEGRIDHKILTAYLKMTEKINKELVQLTKHFKNW